MTLLEYMDLLNFSNKLGGFKAEYNISFQKKIFTVSPTHPVLKPGASGLYTSDWEYNKPQYDDNGYITFDLFGKASSLMLSGNKITDVRAKSIKFDKENNIVSIEAGIYPEIAPGAERINLRIKNVTLKDLGISSVKFDETGSIQEFNGYAEEIYQDNRAVKKGFFFKPTYKVKLKVQGDQVYYDIQ